MATLEGFTLGKLLSESYTKKGKLSTIGMPTGDSDAVYSYNLGANMFMLTLTGYLYGATQVHAMYDLLDLLGTDDDQKTFVSDKIGTFTNTIKIFDMTFTPAGTSPMIIPYNIKLLISAKNIPHPA